MRRLWLLGLGVEWCLMILGVKSCLRMFFLEREWKSFRVFFCNWVRVVIDWGRIEPEGCEINFVCFFLILYADGLMNYVWKYDLLRKFRELYKGKHRGKHFLSVCMYDRCISLIWLEIQFHDWIKVEFLQNWKQAWKEFKEFRMQRRI